MQILASRRTQAAETSAAPPSSRGPSSSNDAHLSRGEIFKRIEEDRERHKRLRERRWVQAQPQIVSHGHSSHHYHASPSPATSTGSGSGSGTYGAYALTSFLPLSEGENAELALDIEFENEWEATSDWNEDDVEAVMEERELCFPHLRQREVQGAGQEELEVEKVLAEGEEGGEEPMDLS